MKISAIVGTTNQHSASIAKARKNVLALIAAGGLMLSSSALKAQEPEKDAIIIDKTELTEETTPPKEHNTLIYCLGFLAAVAGTVGFMAGALKIISPLCDKIAEKYGTDETDIFPLDF